MTISIATNDSQAQNLARIDFLDVLRGIALLGIFLMNIEFFNRSLLLAGTFPPAADGNIDIMFARATEILITGKFWILFSLLFGMGFVVMKTQADLKGMKFIPMYLRRSFALLIFGLLHIAFLWSGDILHSYALAAFVFMFIPLIPSKYSILLGVMLAMTMPLVSLSTGILGLLMPELMGEELAAVASEFQSLAAEASPVYASGTYIEVTAQRMRDFSSILSNEIFVVMTALGFFFIGAGIMRSGALLNLEKYRSSFIKYGLIFGTLGVVLIAIAQGMHTYQPLSPKGMLHLGLMMIGNLPLSIAYLCLAAVLMGYSGAGRILKLFAPAGKMALTNYLMQSVIASSVFYGYGLGYWGQWGRASLVVFVIVVFATQIVFSHLWLRYFNYGPMEWIWRAITYMKLPQMKKLPALSHT
jgi:uncharacterized protein